MTPRSTAVFDPGTVTAWSAGTGGKAVSPRAAMVALVMVSWQRWQYYAQLLHEQIKTAAAREQRPEAPPAEIGGVVGVRTSASSAVGGSGLYATGEQIRALVELEGTERERCARLLRQAHDMGITNEELHLNPPTREVNHG